MSIGLYPFELDILKWSLSAKATSLIEHLKYVVVSDRNTTGGGELISFKYVDEGSDKFYRSGSNGYLENLLIESTCLIHGAGYAVWVQDGLIDHMDVFPYGDNWPGSRDIKDYKVCYPASLNDR